MIRKMKSSLYVTDEIINYLIEKDNTFIYMKNRYGLVEYSLDQDLFESVVMNIVGQMLSLSAADKIYNRVVVLCNGAINAENLSRLNREQLRNCGMSYSKADYILEFSMRCLNKEFNFDNLDSLNDVEVIKFFRRIKGVGLWTAEMLSLFALGRENIFSYDDVALRNGIIKAKGFKTLSKKRFESLRKRYSPYCSYASLYFYKVNDDKEYEKCMD